MPTSTEKQCRVCDNRKNNRQLTVREMLHGTREEYDYLHCGSCGCLQLAEIPDDLSQFYPEDYCCHKDYRKRTKNVLRRVFDTWRVGASLPKNRPIARLLNAIAPRLDYVPWMQSMGVERDSRILDVGCGTGKLLIRMSMGGFETLHGIDPFINGDIHVGNVRIDKIGTQQFIDTCPEKYDLVMLHHAFEHVPDPVETLLEAKELMTDEGHLLIRIPVADCYSREHYGENWYSWDAPRHTYLHTLKSMEYLATKTGLTIRNVEHDATYHQLQKSELYKRGISGNKHRQAIGQFTSGQIREFKLLTAKLNREQRGEQAAFFLQKTEANSSRRAA